jgi:branched-chain amino acid transport system substrate-binding protein
LLGSPGFAWADGDTLRIGVLVPSSGPLTLYGDPMERAAKLLFGGMQKSGLAGRQVKFTIYDTEGSVPKAVQLFQRLVDDDEVDVVVGPFTSGEGFAILPIANRAKVTTLVIGVAEGLTKPVTPYIFAVTPVDAVVVRQLLQGLKDRHHKRVALIYSLDGLGQSGGKKIQESVADYGIELVSVETFSPQDTNMTPQLLRIREKTPDAVVMWTATNPGPTIVLRTAKELGIKAPFFLSYGQASNAFLEQAHDVAEGAYVTGLAILSPSALPDMDPRKPIVADIVANYQARYGTPPDQSVGDIVDAKIIIEAAVKKIEGPITRDNLRNAMESVEVCGLYGCRHFSPTEHRGNDKNATILMQIRNGKWGGSE